MTTRTEILTTKLTNFQKFVKENIPQELSVWTEVLQALSVDQLIMYTNVELIPNRARLERYVDGLLEKHDVKKETIADDVYKKLIRYLECFCEICV